MTNVVMPQMGESIAEGTIVRWIKKVGDSIDRDEPLFEFASLELRADQDGDVVEGATRAHMRFGFLADAARLLRPIPDADNADLFAVPRIGPQGLA